MIAFFAWAIAIFIPRPKGLILVLLRTIVYVVATVGSAFDLLLHRRRSRLVHLGDPSIVPVRPSWKASLDLLARRSQSDRPVVPFVLGTSMDFDTMYSPRRSASASGGTSPRSR